MSQVFISYNKTDAVLAAQFRRRIVKAGFGVWMFPKLRAGTEWRDVIDEEIRKSIAVVVIMTVAAKRSEYVTYEWSFAYGVGVRVIPVIYIDPSQLHPRLSGLQYRDFRGTPVPWRELIEDLQDADTVSTLSVHAAVWGPRKQMIDVTKKVRQNVSGGSVKMQANRDVFQDPLHGEKKILYVFYSKHGQQIVEKVLEHDDLEIG